MLHMMFVAFYLLTFAFQLLKEDYNLSIPVSFFQNRTQEVFKILFTIFVIISSSG